MLMESLKELDEKRQVMEPVTKEELARYGLAEKYKNVK